MQGRKIEYHLEEEDRTLHGDEPLDIKFSFWLHGKHIYSMNFLRALLCDTLILTTFISNRTQVNNTADNVMWYYNQIFPASFMQKPLINKYNTINNFFYLIKTFTVFNY